MGKLNSREIDAPFDIPRLTACNEPKIAKSNEATFYRDAWKKRRGPAASIDPPEFIIPAEEHAATKHRNYAGNDAPFTPTQFPRPPWPISKS